MNRASRVAALLLALASPLGACGGGSGGSGGAGAGPGSMPSDGLPHAGNSDGSSPVPAEAMPEDTSSPDHVVGDGTPASCTGAAFVAAVAQGVRVTVDADS